MKRIGALIHDLDTNRYDIRFSLNEYYGGLHCGECFEVLIEDGSYVPVRIEYSYGFNKWCLIGLNDVRLDGLKVRIAI